jgi:hypothetical protein
MMAIAAIQRSGLRRLKGDVILERTVGEENMDSATFGAGGTVKRGYTADAAIVSEPSAPPHALAVLHYRVLHLVPPRRAAPNSQGGIRDLHSPQLDEWLRHHPPTSSTGR